MSYDHLVKADRRAVLEEKVTKAAEQYIEYFFPKCEMGGEHDVGGRLIKAVREYQNARANDFKDG